MQRVPLHRGQTQAQANQYLKKEFPKLSYIRKIWMQGQMPSPEEGSEGEESDDKEL